MNVGEELVAAYLQHIKGCEFIQQNLYTPDTQGEVDVVGINLSERAIYVCEVAIHLATGLYYVKGNQPNNIGKLTDKFSRNIEYAKKYFHDYRQHFMLWTPIIKKSRDHAVLNQERDLKTINEQILSKHGVSIEFVVNEDFQRRLDELRQYAGSKSEEIKNPVLRLFQIEEALGKHLARRAKKATQ